MALRITRLVSRSTATFPHFSRGAAALSLRFTRVRRLLPLLALLAGCSKDPETVWSTSAINPDGDWVATAKALSWSGPGNASSGTAVYLKRPKQADSEATRVLFVAHEDPTMNVTLTWATSKHLHVRYGPKVRDRTVVEFQAIKFGDVEISIEKAPPSAFEPAVK